MLARLGVAVVDVPPVRGREEVDHRVGHQDPLAALEHPRRDGVAEQQHHDRDGQAAEADHDGLLDEVADDRRDGDGADHQPAEQVGGGRAEADGQRARVAVDHDGVVGGVVRADQQQRQDRAEGVQAVHQVLQADVHL